MQVLPGRPVGRLPDHAADDENAHCNGLFIWEILVESAVDKDLRSGECAAYGVGLTSTCTSPHHTSTDLVLLLTKNDVRGLNTSLPWSFIMSAQDQSALRDLIRRRCTVRFVRPPKDARQFPLPYHHGLVFRTCWSGERRLLHLSKGDCRNCEIGSSEALFSVFISRAGPNLKPVGLVLPESPTLQLLELGLFADQATVPVVTTSRRGFAGGHVNVSVRYVPRREPLLPSVQSRWVEQLERFVLKYFAGALSDADVLNECRPFVENQRSV